MDVRKVVCYSFDLPSRNSLAYLRLIGPLHHLGVELVDGYEDGKFVVEKVLQGDIVVIQRNFPRMFEEYQKIIEFAQREGKPIIFEMDDLLFRLPEDHPYQKTRDYVTALLPMYQALADANLVIVSTKQLADLFENYNKNIAVIPNYLDDNVWQLHPPVQNRSKGEQIIIGFMGTASHKPDIEFVAPVLIDIHKKYPKRISIRFWGLEPPEEMRSFSQETALPPFSKINEYKDFADFFQTQFADIFIAPLVDNEFNRCKSSIKYFEYSSLGAPGVYSSLEPYNQVITHGKNGLLASSLDEWSECLIRLIEDDELRYQLALHAQASIRENWLLSQNAFRWQEAFTNISRGTSSLTATAQPNLLQSINAQLSQFLRMAEFAPEMIAERKAHLSALTLHTEELGKTIQLLTSHVGFCEQQIETLTGEVASRELQIQALTGQVASREEQILALTGQVVSLKEEIQALTSQVTLRVQETQALREQLELSKAEIIGYTQSTSWKVTKPLRMIKKMFQNFKNAFN
jgi:processive 1,2-diacylglycerol beta-glucosyltransferase